MNARNLTDFSKSSMALGPRLEALGVGVNMSGRKLLDDISVEFRAGHVTAILGPNGAGKSTLMSSLTGQRKPDAGHVELEGRVLQGCAPAELARLRAFVAQETQVAFDFTVREVVDLGRYPHRMRPSPQEAHIAGLAMQATAVEHLADRSLNTLSGGEKARVHLSRALAQVWESSGNDKSRWLLLDEPTAALDLQHQHRMLQLARRWADAHGVGVIAVLHDLNLALRYSDRCIVLKEGRLFAAGETSVVLNEDCIGNVWGVTAHPVRTGGTAAGVLQYVFEAAVG